MKAKDSYHSIDADILHSIHIYMLNLELCWAWRTLINIKGTQYEMHLCNLYEKIQNIFEVDMFFRVFNSLLWRNSIKWRDNFFYIFHIIPVPNLDVLHTNNDLRLIYSLIKDSRHGWPRVTKFIICAERNVHIKLFNLLKMCINIHKFKLKTYSNRVVYVILQIKFSFRKIYFWYYFVDA